MREPIGSRILLVENNAESRHGRAEILGGRGYHVRAVASLAELDPAWRSDDYHLVLLSLGSTGSALDMATWRRVQRAWPAQRFLFVLSDPERLCPMFFNEELVRGEELSEAFLGRVEAALALPVAG